MSSQRQLIDRSHTEALSIQRQCDLLGISRSTFYYDPVPASERDLAIMRAIDELHLDYPFFGYRRLSSHLLVLFVNGLHASKHKNDTPIDEDYGYSNPLS
jgi:hypothetical protein